MRKVYRARLLAMVLLLTIFITSCHKDSRVIPTLSPEARTYSSTQLQNYFTMMCTITKNTQGFYPTQAARAYGYIGIAAYESVRNGIPGIVKRWRR